VIRIKVYNVLLLEAEYRKVLPVVRAFAKKGHNVYTVSLNKFSIGGSSKYVKKNYFVEQLTVQNVLEIVEKHNIDVIIPSNEKSVELLSSNEDKFTVPLVTPSMESYLICRDKLKTIQFAEKLGVRVPKTFTFKDYEDFKDHFHEIDVSPLVLKPKSSAGSRGLLYIDNKEQLLNTLTKDYIDKYGFPIIQERIPSGGRPVGSSFLYYDGQEVLCFCHQRLREYPPSGGPSTLAISIYDQKALDIGRKLLSNLKWNGLAMVEFKEDPRTSELVLMEINPRMWGTIGLAIFSGADFTDAIVKVFLENVDPNDVDKEYKSGCYFRWVFPGDIMSIMLSKNLTAGQKFRELFRRYDNVTYQIAEKGDVKPIFAMLMYSIAKQFGHIIQ